MCLGVPAKILELKADNLAIVESEGVIKEVSMALIENPQIGEYVIIHVGYALNKIDEDEAQRTFDLINEIGKFENED